MSSVAFAALVLAAYLPMPWAYLTILVGGFAIGWIDEARRMARL